MRIVAVGLLLSAIASVASADDPAPAADPEVIAALRRVWSAAGPPGFADLALLEDRAKVLVALEAPSLWPSQEPGTHTWTFDAPDGLKTTALVKLPAGYTPERAWPLAIGLHGTSSNKEHQMTYLERVLDPSQWVFVSVASCQPGPFAGGHHEIGQAASLLPELSRRLRLDRDRVLVTGYSKGGHCSFACAVLHGAWFAGEMPVAGSWTVGPFWPKTAQLLLPNLSHERVTVIFGEHDITGAPGKNKLNGITPLNRHIAKLFGQWKRRHPGVEDVVFQELKGYGHTDNWPGDAQRERWSSSVRPPVGERKGKRERRWRYPPESWLDGARVTELKGAPFDPRAKVRLNPKAGESGDRALARYLDERYGMLSVRWDPAGNRVYLRQSRAETIELWLQPGAPLDLSKPIEVRVDGKRRFYGAVAPTSATLLRWLRLTGDTARPMQARLLIPRRGAVRVNPDDVPAGFSAYPSLGG